MEGALSITKKVQNDEFAAHAVNMNEDKMKNLAVRIQIDSAHPRACKEYRPVAADRNAFWVLRLVVNQGKAYTRTLRKF